MHVELSLRLCLINGPNINLLGLREPEIYGLTTLTDIELRLTNFAKKHGIQLKCLQSNHEGEIVDFIAKEGLLARDGGFDGVIINPAAFTHSSVAIRDALTAGGKPFVEVHLSNVHAREPFRQHSYLSDKASGVIVGMGDLGYDMAMMWFLKHVYGVNVEL
ncbi:MAG: type II 3-dehydroquinate dehydratase [Moraxella sp.]|nr:type II 3-dehydroquinate dehydratase [Moraxella sp.]